MKTVTCEWGSRVGKKDWVRPRNQRWFWRSVQF